MVYQKSPSHLWRKSSGLYCFKLGIPATVRAHYPADRPGQVKTHIVESLRTHNRAEALKLKEALLAKYRDEFARLESGQARKLAVPVRAQLEALRAHLAELQAGHHGEQEAVGLHLVTQAEELHQRLHREEGPAAADLALRMLMSPGVKTLTEALQTLLQQSENTEQTQGAYRLAVRDLLQFLKTDDCLPQEVTEQVAVRYVDMLNAGGLSKAAKKKRISNLNQLWKHMRRREWPASPWEGHQVTESKPAAGPSSREGDEDSEEVRPFTEEEAVRVITLADPDDLRKRTYTRPLFRELYALGFVTGMRLNELVSLRPMDVVTLDDQWRLVAVPESVAKTPAGARKLPVCHPVAVAILDARHRAQTDPRGRLFHECVPGGPDQKPSWHVSKAMSRERLDPKRLNFGSEVNFHSTRRNFATLMENSQVEDVIGQQRYLGHSIPTQMHGVYSGGAGIEKLKRIVSTLQYPAGVEAALLQALRADPRG